jgi:integrase
VTIIRVKGFQVFRDRYGQWRCYHRKTKTRVDLKAAPLGTPEFFAECARIADGRGAKIAGKPGSLGLLVCEYRKSAAFLDLAPRTQADYQGLFEYLRPIADTPLANFDRPLVVRIRDKAAATLGRRRGNYIKSVLSVLFSWGRERGFLQDNPASGIKGIRRQKGAPEANRPWSDEEREAVLAAASAYLRPAIALMMFAGLGPKDALTLPRNFVKGGEIATRRSKTGEPVFWPMPAPLAAILASAPTHIAITLCVNSRGRPWTQGGFRSMWGAMRDRLEREGKVGPGLTLYGLRHTLAVILRESGADERTIADALGQRTIEMARHYAKGADLRGKMRGVVKDFDAELAKRKKPTK